MTVARLPRIRRSAIRFPRHLERQYGSRLLRRLRVAHRLVRTHLLDGHRRDNKLDEDKLAEIQSRLQIEIAAVRSGFEAALPVKPESLTPTAAGVDNHTTKGIAAAVKSVVAVDVEGDSRIGTRTRLGMRELHWQWARENVELIRTMERETFDDLAEHVAIAVAEGRTDLAEVIARRFGVAESRAKLIARDQIGSLNSRITEARQTQLGIDAYEWSDSGDSRVRPLHRKLNGTIRRWSDPHPTEGHPGRAIACRCVAIPVIDPDALPSPTPASSTPSPPPATPPAPFPAPVPVPATRPRGVPPPVAPPSAPAPRAPTSPGAPAPSPAPSAPAPNDASVPSPAAPNDASVPSTQPVPAPPRALPTLPPDPVPSFPLPPPVAPVPVPVLPPPLPVPVPAPSLPPPRDLGTTPVRRPRPPRTEAQKAARRKKKVVIPERAPPFVAPILDLTKIRSIEVFGGVDDREVARVTTEAIGRPATATEILGWTGVDQEMVRNASVWIEMDGHQIAVEVRNSQFVMRRQYRRDDEGRLSAHHDLFVLNDGKGEGVGARLFARQVAALRNSGFEVIDVLAAGSWQEGQNGGFNGYYTWPRFGYDGALHSDLIPALPPALKDARMMLDVMSTEEGRDWWKKKGRWINLEFDLTEGSRSLQVHEAYLAERKLRLDALLEDLRDASRAARRDANDRRRPQEEIELSAEDEAALERAWAGLVLV